VSSRASARILVGLALLLPGAAAAAPAQRAVWMWEQESYEIALDAAAAAEAIAFLRSKKIRTVYLYADAFEDRNLIEAEPQRYRQLVRRMHQRGMKVYALLGSAYLHTEEYMLPERRQPAVAMFQRVLTYNAAAAPAERFDGVNLDIEPHILDQWSTHKLQLLEQFLDLGQALMELKRRSGQTLPVGPAIPLWLDNIVLDWHGRSQPVSDHVLDIYDYVALMDYRDHAEGRDGIIRHAGNELAAAARRRRKVVVGVEVTPNEIQKVSFDHLTEADLERELALAERAFRDEPAFAGFAIHHYRSYRKWLERQAAGARP
jgi:hypothetical protein